MKKILVIILGVFLISCNNQVEKKHNILFISIDDLRPTMNSYNYEKETMITPYMDKLASEGVQFNNAFTNIAVCGASRASIMTGVRPSEKRFNDFSTRASVDAPNAIPLNQILRKTDMKLFHMEKFIIITMTLHNIGPRKMEGLIRLIFKILNLLD